MIFEKKPSFERAWKSLDPGRRSKAKVALDRLISFFEGGQKPEGLGLKKLREDYWEIRSDIRDRVVFRLTPGRVEFILIGNHNDISRFLKRAY